MAVPLTSRIERWTSSRIKRSTDWTADTRMQFRLAGYLGRRLDRPLAWLSVFAIGAAVAGFAAGFKQEGVSGALLGATVGCVVGGMVGIAFGIPVWFISRLLGGLDRSVARPDRWGIPLVCDRCGWRTSPEGPWRLRDCLSPPTSCPACEQRLRSLVPHCPACNAASAGPVRRPRSVRQALRDGCACSQCGCEYDKWGRQASESPPTP